MTNHLHVLSKLKVFVLYICQHQQKGRLQTSLSHRLVPRASPQGIRYLGKALGLITYMILLNTGFHNSVIVDTPCWKIAGGLDLPAAFYKNSESICPVCMDSLLKLNLGQK